MVLPEWLDSDAWKGYLAMRKKIKRPLTDYAMTLAIRKLEQMRVEGQDIQAVLEQSIFNSWIGLFPVKGTAQNEPDAAQAWHQLREAIRHQKPPTGAVLQAANAIGGFHRLSEATSFEIERKEADFKRAYKQGAH